MVEHGPELLGTWIYQQMVSQGIIRLLKFSIDMINCLIFPDLNALLPTTRSKVSPANIRVEESLLKTEDVKQERAVETAGAVNYQMFQQGKGTKKEPEKPKKEVVSRPLDSNYLVYEIERSDGSVIFVPII